MLIKSFWDLKKKKKKQKTLNSEDHEITLNHNMIKKKNINSKKFHDHSD